MKIDIKKICVAVLAMCMVTACDLDTSPTVSLDASGVYKDTKNAERVLRGVWNYVFNEGLSYASLGYGTIMLSDDFAGSDAVRTLSYGLSASYNLTNGYSRGEHCRALWDLMYDPINNCNAILKHIDDVSGSKEEKDRIKGQTYASRAFMYLVLASHYSFAIDKDPDAVCVPIYTEPTDYNQAVNGQPAASVSEVYAQVLSDLKNALELIPENYSHGNDATKQYQIDHLVALGLMARASLYARHWDDAYKYATAALAINPYLMNEEEYKSGFNDYTNKEWMWSLSCTIDDNDPCYLFYFKDCTPESGGYTSLNTDPYFKEKLDDTDYRKDLFNWGQTAYQDWALLNNKFRFKDIENMLGDIVMMRTSEMYLIKAEAAAHIAGKESEAQQTLQIMRDARTKAGMKARTVTETGEALIKEIWMERRRELWGEGFSLVDIIRNQQPVERKEYNGIATKPDGTPILDKDGKTIPVKGHTITSLPDKTDFVPNSIYYLLRIPEKEELQNPVLYSKHPKLPEYVLEK
ncbi:RagB/SusD family nutrient uptake outer membrane protein [Bacteroides sp. GD17]|jgi:hypothetical protein|uniref:RagB/SusD family nutrient uptake outer membrane protein n=1 Tax=Bacteroides sp. GD17 TaxID=3139826 RepID=UPI0025E16D94|nr:RagB/SusD family nutrient uptake outer membrane protein [uncultured Bacteroides sp.]